MPACARPLGTNSKSCLKEQVHITRLCFGLQKLKNSKRFQNQGENRKCMTKSVFLPQWISERSQDFRKQLLCFAPRKVSLEISDSAKRGDISADNVWLEQGVPYCCKQNEGLSCRPPLEGRPWNPDWIHNVVETKASTLWEGKEDTL